MICREAICTGAVLVACMSAFAAVRAQGIASEQLIDSITVTAERERIDVGLPGPIASKTREDLSAQNFTNPEDALRYAPNLTIRKRYIGDRNSLIGGRSFSTLQAARALVFMDGYLLSNFLGRFDAPRWNMIAPEEIERVDVLYGPYSAIYPGNSIGTTVSVRTRRPQELQMSVRTTAFAEQFEEYGINENYAGYQLSAYLADRFENGAWLSLSATRQDATSHPMQYYTVSTDASGRFPTVVGPATAVTGVQFDSDPQGRRRAVFGAHAGAIDHTVQNQAKLRGGVAISESLDAEGFVSIWRNDTHNENRTFMRDSAGHEVWSGRVEAEGIAFDIPEGAFAPSVREEQHVLWGSTLRTTRPSGWNASLVYSEYAIRRDFTLEATAADPLAALGGPGTSTERDGTGWQTLELQGVYTPLPSDWLDGAHTITVGAHQNEYQLDNPVYDTLDWRYRGGLLAQESRGETQLRAIYLQDSWDIRDAWALTLGLRYEDWSAFRGVQRLGSLSIDYPERHETALSPKVSLAFAPNAVWSLRLSAGRGVRFPTVAELFQGATRGTSIIVNAPDLNAEISDSLDLTLQANFEWGRLRTSVFQDDVRDSIFGQTNITVTPSITNVQNVDRVRTRGIETAFFVDRLSNSLSVEGSVAYARAKILDNDNFPVSVGNDWPRVPQWRGHVQAIWRPTPSWLASVGLRYSGRMYNRLQNDDRNPDTYGGVSRFTIADVRLAYTLGNNTQIAIGIDNLTNERSYQSHPLQTRTAFVEARWTFSERT